MTDHSANIQSLSDDEDDEKFSLKMTRFIGKDRVIEINEDGYCSLDGQAHAIERVQLLISGWVRTASHPIVKSPPKKQKLWKKVLKLFKRRKRTDRLHRHNNDASITPITPSSRCTVSLPLEMHDIIVRFYGLGFDANLFLHLQSEGQNPGHFLVPRKFIVLSPLLEQTTNYTVQINKVDAETLNLVLQWMCHHKGIEPAPIQKPVISVVMMNIVSDSWDAQFMDALDKQLIFRVILAANYLGIESLSM